MNEKLINAAFKVAKDYVGRNLDYFGVLLVNEDEINHVAMMLQSALGAKYEFGYPPGGFIESVLNNDLYGALSKADNINRKALPLIVAGLHNISLSEIEKKTVCNHTKTHVSVGHESGASLKKCSDCGQYI